MFTYDRKYHFTDLGDQVVLLAENKSAYVYFGSSSISWLESEYPSITAIDAYDPLNGLWDEANSAFNTLILENNQGLLLPNVAVTDTLVTEYIKIPSSATEVAEIPFELATGGVLHFHDRPEYDPSVYSITYMLPSEANLTIIQDKYDADYFGQKIIIGPATDTRLIDAANQLYQSLENYWEGGSLSTVSDAFSVGGSDFSLLELFDQAANFSSQMPQEFYYFALMEVASSNSADAVYFAPEGIWLKPIFANTVQDLSAIVLDENGDLENGLWDFGIWNGPVDGSGPTLSNIRFNDNTIPTDQLMGMMQYFVPLTDYIDYNTAASVNNLLWNVTGEYYAPQPDFVALDILWTENWYLDLPSAAGDQQAYLDSLILSDNNDINLTVYQNYATAIPSPNLSFDFPEANAVKNINLFAQRDFTTELSGLNFASGQSLTLLPPYDVSESGFSLHLEDVPNTAALPANIILEDGAYLFIEGDTNAHAIPNIVNDGMGVLDFVGGETDETIFGTEGKDYINGRGGDDILYGGSGPDGFIFYHDQNGNTSGHDVIMDFNPDEGDYIYYSFWDGTGMAQGQPVSTIEETYGNAGAYFEDGNGDYYFEGGSVEVRQGGMPASSIMEIYEIPGERWGNYIYFGARLKDEFKDMDFDNFNFGLSWDTNDFTYVPGTFEAGSATTYSMQDAGFFMQDAMASGGQLSAAFIADSTYAVDDNGTPEEDDDKDVLDKPFNFGTATYEVAGDIYQHDPYIAKFMLERIDESSGQNSFTHFSAYTYIEENTELGGFDEIAKAPTTGDALAQFDYGPDNLKVNVANPLGTYAPNPELFVSDGTMADGLSIVPVDKMGDIVVFQVMMNVSYPTTLLGTLDHANSASIEITADEIFTDSVYQRVDDATTVGAVTALLSADGGAAAAITTEDKAAVDFWDEVDTIADGDGDFTALNTASTIKLDFAGIGGGSQIAQDGKYVLAEFVARNSDAGFDYSYFNNDVDATTAASSISMYSQAILDGTLTRSIDDGSDVTVLGDTYYQNPFSFAARINSNDASTALKISVADPGGSRYGEADFMAADYNGDGEVTSGDALDILRTAAFMDPSDPDAGPFWSYVRDVDTASSLVQLGVVNPGVDDGNGNFTDVDLTPTVYFDRSLDMFIGTDTVIDAMAVLTGDTDHNYMPLTSQQDPVLNYYDGFIGDWSAPATPPTTSVTPPTLEIDFQSIASAGVMIGNIVNANGDGNVLSTNTPSIAKVSAATNLSNLAAADNILAFSGDQLEANTAGELMTKIISSGMVFSFANAGDPSVQDGIITLYDDGTDTNLALLKFTAAPAAGMGIFANSVANIVDLNVTLNGVEVDAISNSSVKFVDTSGGADPFDQYNVVNASNVADPNFVISTAAKEIFEFADFSNETVVKSGALNNVMFPTNVSNGDLLLAFDRGMDEITVVGDWDATYPVFATYATNDPISTHVTDFDPNTHDVSWNTNVANATIVTFENIPAFTNSASGSNNAMQALIIDTNMSGDYEAASDLLLYVDNWGGGLTSVDLLPTGILAEL